MSRSQTGKELGKHRLGRWEKWRDDREAGCIWHILGTVRRLLCLKLSVRGRESDLSIVAKIVQSLSRVFRFYSK